MSHLLFTVPVRITRPQAPLKVNDALTCLLRSLPGTPGHPLISTRAVPGGTPEAFLFEVGLAPDLPPVWAQSQFEAALREAHGLVLGDLGAVHFGSVQGGSVQEA